MNFLKVVFVAVIFVSVGCNSKQPLTQQSLQLELLRETDSLSAEKEFSENLKSGHIVFYGRGGNWNGCEVPGLSENEVTAYIGSKMIEVKLRFIDDPAPFGASAEYWRRVDEFLARYNRLVVQEIQKRNRGTIRSDR